MKRILIDPVESPYLVPFDGSFEIDGSATKPPEDAPGKKKNKAALEELQDQLKVRQRVLYADDRYSVLLVFQAMDAAGKDGTIRAVMSGVNPAGCQVFSFKQPSKEELDHDFMWRVYQCLPERGRIGIFNRSHYEETLVVRVHPEYLGFQRLPREIDLDSIWDERLKSIRDFERHWARNGTVVLKFFLNVSRDEQRDRFLDRIDEPESNWKFAVGDVKERGHWDAYMEAYQATLNATSRPWAPWYVIPADNKPYMRRCVADIVVSTLDKLDMAFPSVSKGEREEMLGLREQLAEE
jgi:PPK2 family polyphosphate:nucleotide phosphotransferase